MTLLFGYQTVTGVPLCRCNDPGNYLMAEQPGDDPLVIRFRCWCGATMSARFDDLEERAAFLEEQARNLEAVRPASPPGA